MDYIKSIATENGADWVHALHPMRAVIFDSGDFLNLDKPESGRVTVKASIDEETWKKAVENVHKAFEPSLECEETSAVDHPSYYGGKDNPYEAIKIMDAFGWGENFCRASALKYLVRAGEKDDTVQDLMKARWYIDHLIEGYKDCTYGKGDADE